MEIKTDLPDQRISDTLVSGIEGGIGYWCQIQNRYNSRTTDQIVAGDYALILREDPDDDGKYTGPELKLDKTAVQRGIEIMAKKYPKHYADMVNENDDASTGDVLIQCALLGEIVYG